MRAGRAFVFASRQVSTGSGSDRVANKHLAILVIDPVATAPGTDPDTLAIRVLLFSD
jgi:hypothetical protein